MKYRIEHHTSYVNAQPVSVGHNEAWLTPRNTDSQRVVSHRIEIDPVPSSRCQLVDYFGNSVTQFLFNQGYTTLSISAYDEVEMLTREPATDGGPTWEQVVDEVRAHATISAMQAYEFTFESPRCRPALEFAEYGRSACQPGRPLREVLAELLFRIHEDFSYDTQATTVTTPVEQVFRQRRGVCQDFSHLMISVLRSLGFAARYVSGYLRTLPPPGKPRLVGADASHAWLAVYGGAGTWIDLDPTNGHFPSTDHVTLAWGRDYSDVAPVKGVYIGGGSPQLQVSVDVCPLDPESPEPA